MISGTRLARPERVGAKTLNLVLAAVQAMPATFTAERVQAATNRKSSAVGDALAILRDKGYIVPSVGHRPIIWHKTSTLPPINGPIVTVVRPEAGIPSQRYADLRTWVHQTRRLEALALEVSALGLTDAADALRGKTPPVTPLVMADVLTLVDDLGGFDE